MGLAISSNCSDKLDSGVDDGGAGGEGVTGGGGGGGIEATFRPAFFSWCFRALSLFLRTEEGDFFFLEKPALGNRALVSIEREILSLFPTFSIEKKAYGVVADTFLKAFRMHVILSSSISALDLEQNQADRSARN